MLWQNTSTGDRSIWLMNGTTWDGSYAALPRVPTTWSIAGSADFTGDGQADILWQNSATGDRSIWFMNGNTWTGDYALLPNVPASWSMAGAGDFNADGKPDIVWENLTTGDRSIWFMNGSTWTGNYALLPNVPTEWEIRAIGDFNRDGMLDLVWHDVVTGQNSIWFMNGSSWTGNYVLLATTPTNWRIAAAADFDGDTDPDIVWQDVQFGERSVWLMKGSSWSIYDYTMLPTVPTEWSIAGIMPGPPVPQLPAAPSGLEARVSSESSVTLTWVDNSGDETGFRVEQCRGEKCRLEYWVEIGTVPANNTAFQATGVSAGNYYMYRVRAYNAVGNSEYSNIAIATTPLPSG
jgi:hypothetical protein